MGGTGSYSTSYRSTNSAYPRNTLLMIDRLVQEPLLIEVSAVAAL
jgi:hypothetical protein